MGMEGEGEDPDIGWNSRGGSLVDEAVDEPEPERDQETIYIVFFLKEEFY